ncbi:MAG: rhamnulokinase [Lachnospiraceae bacterium]|jgi:rhamnulokinase|nr:rhamnulokinase [Lachnospiraceae bacterium]
MNSGYFLAVDIGASGGRHILGSCRDGRISLEEVYRFENGMVRRNGHLCWDTERLFREILNGLRKCAQAGKVPVSMSIDTWAVDYALLDRDGRLLGETYGYRDGRTAGMEQKVAGVIAPDALYARTGIQKQPFNTIYQLAALKEQEPEILERADCLLMLPDYFHFLLTGNRCSEYTNATTTQLVSPVTGQWDRELTGMLGFPEKIFLPLSMPGTPVGHFRKEIADDLGFDCEVVLPATHDTASAVMSVPSVSDDVLYISSGTWSLMGTETHEAVCTPAAEKANFTNEGGYERRFRFLKNIMGLWMIQSVRHELGDSLSFAQLCGMAEESRDFPSRVDVNDSCFLAPESMTGEIRAYCGRTGQKVPDRTGEIAAVIYRSLAESYADTAQQIEEITGRHYSAIHIVGGGSKADYLNRLTAEITQRTVLAGPGEATAAGNILAQMLKAGLFPSLREGRRCIFDSFGVKTY